MVAASPLFTSSMTFSLFLLCISFERRGKKIARYTLLQDDAGATILRLLELQTRQIR